jgi:hypothetical protein
MALDVEGVVGRCMKREKSLRGSDALEPLHLPLPSSGRLMRIRDEDDDPGSPADVVSRPGYSTSRARAYPAPRHLSAEAQRPQRSNPSRQPAKILHPRPLARRRRRPGASTSDRNQMKSRERDVLRAAPVRALHNAGFRNGPVGVKSLVPASSIFGRPRERASQIAL